MSDEKHSSFSGLNQYAGPWGQAQILHLIRRTMFGVSGQDYLCFSKLNLQQSIELLLKPSPTPIPPLNAYNDNTFTDPDIPFGQTWVNCKFSDNKGVIDDKRKKSLEAWWVGLMINQERTLTEKMTLFWHNHVAGSFQRMHDPKPAYGYVAILRRNSMANFKKLMLDITTCPGMLHYLSGVISTAVAPNENYSRELQELFTVGKGPASKYTQEDVQAAARVLTGWTTGEAVYVLTHGTDDEKNPREGETIFNAAWHDTGDKKFSAFYNNTIIKGKGGQSGAEETTELINMLFANQEVARHTCRALYRWFVNSKIDDYIESQIIHPLAEIFIKNDYEIVPVLKTLLSSEHFFNVENIGIQIKNPVDHLVGFCRQLNIIPSQTDLQKQYNAWYFIATELFRQTMQPGYPPSVAGWPAYYISPSYYQYWINSNTLVARHRITDTLLSPEEYSNSQIGTYLQYDFLPYVIQYFNPSDPDKLIADCTAMLSPFPLTPAQTSLLNTILNDSEFDTISWHKVWSNYVNDPSDSTKKATVNNRLSKFFICIFRQAEYQLM